jgi:hypothetical protein
VKNILNDVTDMKIDYVYTDNVFETKANNAGLKMVDNDYVLLIQDDMVVNEKDFDVRMMKPFQTFNDVFAVTSFVAHNNIYNENTGEITFGQIDPSRGNMTQAVVIEAAGFNGKPTILCEKEFVALEGESLYRGVKSVEQVTDFKESIVQYAGEGYMGNGTYSSNKQVTAYAYAGQDRESNADRLPRIMEMKMLPTANVMDFETVNDMRTYAKKLGSDFVTQYKESGANPQQQRYAEAAFTTNADWTNLAIMSGIDAVRFPAGLQGESYTVILNRGQVAINGD